MNEMTDQFIRRDKWEALKFVVSDDIMSSSKGSSRLSQTLLPTLALQRMVGGLKVIILREGVGKEGVPKSDCRVEVSSFPSSSLCFFDLGIMRDRG